MGGALKERFKIEFQAGVGGMGRVYRAVDGIDGRIVALKILADDGQSGIDRFSREAEVLAKLHHPSIVRYIDHGITESGERFLAMEWLDGIPLSQRLASDPLSIGDSLRIGRQLADALAEAHRAGVVHRDIKPSNVFLVDGLPSRAKLLDFGIARRLREDDSITRTGMLVGSWSYMAPEQAMGSRHIDARADVFALGCVLYECISGRRAFRAENPTAILAKILLNDPPPLSEICEGVSPPLSEFVSRMLQKRPEDRPAGGAEVSAALSELLTQQTNDLIKPSGEAPAITTSEQRVVWAILIGNVADPDTTRDGGRASEQSTRQEEDLKALRSIVEAYGGRLDLLLDRTAIATFSVRANPLDEAPRAGRCALELRAVVPDSPLSMAVGLGVVSEGTPLGSVIDIGTAALRTSEPGVIRLTADGASALGSRFEVRSDDRGPHLVGESQSTETVSRRLLGRPTTCVGRERELAMLESIFAECIGDPIARAVVVIGAAGSGKSRLRYELLRRLSTQSSAPLVLIGRADPVGAGSPFAMLAQPIRQWAHLHTDDTADVQRQKLIDQLERTFEGDSARVARIAPMLGELCGVAFEGGSRPREMRVLGDAMRAAFEDWLAAECRRHPVVLVLEDLHWGDLPTVNFVGSALRHLQDAPFMVVAIGRPEMSQQFPDLWRERHPIQLELGPLTPRASEKLVREVLGSDASTTIVKNIVERAEGNAFYLEELIRAVAEQQTAIPDSVLAMVQARLDTLGPEARRVLRAASVFGSRFRSDGVVALLGGSEAAAEAREQLAYLVSKENLHPVTDGEDDFGYRHALFYEATYAMLTEQDRALGHRLAGEYLEEAFDLDAARLAEHFVRGGVVGRASRWFCRATEQALEGSDLTAAISLGARALESAEDARVRCAVSSMLAEAHRWRGEYATARERATAALEQAARFSPPWFVAAGELIVASANHGEIDAALPYLRTAAEAAAAEDARAEQIICVTRGCTYLHAVGRFEEADRLAACVLPHGADESPLGNTVLARIHAFRAARAIHVGDSGGSVEHLEAAITCSEAVGDSRNACMLRSNLGAIYAEIGELERAEKVLTQVVATAERLGATRVKAYALGNLCEMLMDSGRSKEAREHGALAADLARSLEDPRAEGGTRSTLSHLALEAGEVDVALREAEAAVSLLAEQQLLLPYALARHASVLLHTGRAVEARAKIDAAMAIVDAHGGMELREATVRLTYYRVLAETGETEQAAEVIAAARERLLARAAHITKGALREAFLTNVPDHAATLRLAAKG